MNDQEKEDQSVNLIKEDPLEKKRNEERLKQIQNMTSINVEELDIYLELHFI